MTGDATGDKRAARLFALAVDHAGPVVTAVGLATLSLPIVALSLMIDSRLAAYLGRQLITWSQAPLLAAGATLTSAFVAGGIAGFVRRRWPVAAAVVALWIAWPLAISMLYVVGALVGATVDYGYWCINACYWASQIRGTDAAGGLGAWGGGVFASMFLIVPEVGLLVLGAASLIAAKMGHPKRSLVLGVLAYAALHAFFFFLEPASIGCFVCLALGVVAWWWWLGRRELLRRAVSPR